MAEFLIRAGREAQFTGVDPRLMEILRTAAERAPPTISRVEAYSGKTGRSTGTKNHPQGIGVDVQLYDQAGRPIDNYIGGRAPTDKERADYHVGEQYAQTVRAVQMEIYPELAKETRWGGYFMGGPNPQDMMHFDLSGGRSWKTPPQTARWEKGLEGRDYSVGKAALGEVAVAGRAPITLSPADRDVAIRTIIGEAGGEGPEGQAAVAQVIANRFDQGYGPSVAAIAGDETQFNAWSGDQVLAYGPGDPEYEKVGAIVDDVFGKRPEPPPEVGNSTEFYSGAKEPGYWAKGAVQKVGQIGGHVFGAIKNAVTRPKSFMLRQTSGGEPDPRVAALQTQLKQAGVYAGEVDGRYGPRTTAAVKEWQKSSGQRATGVADVNTLRTLRLPASEAGFQKMFLVNPETPGNRAKLFPEGEPRPANADAIEEALAYDPLEQLRGGEGRDLTSPSVSKDRLGADERSVAAARTGADALEQVSGGSGQDFTAPPLSGDRLGADQISGGGGQDAIGRGKVDNLGGAAASQPPAAAATLTHRTKRGDTFGKLAKQYLGDANRWPEIQDANPGVKARSIPIGTDLVIPGKSSPPTPRAKPDTGAVLNDFNPSSTSGPSLETIRQLGLTPEVWDNIGPDIMAGEGKTGRPDPKAVMDAELAAERDKMESKFLSTDMYLDRNLFEGATGQIDANGEPVAPFRPQASPPAAAAPAAPPAEARAKDDVFVPQSLDDIDRRLAEMRTIDSGRQTAGLPALNRSGGEPWGESYEQDPTLLTDIGLYDRAPEAGVMPANLSLDAMPNRDAASTVAANEPGVRTFEQPAGAPVLNRPTGDASSYRTWGVPWDPLESASMPIERPPEPAREPTVSNTGEGAPSADTWQSPAGESYMTDDRPKPPPAPATSSGPHPRGATITVNGTEYEYDPADDSAEAIDNMLGIRSDVVAPMSYVEAAEGSAMAAPTVPSPDKTQEFTRPDPVNMMALANQEAKKSPGTVTPPSSKPAAPSSPAGGAAAASGTQSYRSSSSGIPSPTNPNFTGKSVETNPLTGHQYAVGTWSNGARAISGNGWTAVENPDGTYSYAGNPLSNASLGLGGP